MTDQHNFLHGAEEGRKMKGLRRVLLVLFFAALPPLLLGVLLWPGSSFSARPAVYAFLGLGAAGGLALICGAALYGDLKKKRRQRIFIFLFMCYEFPPLLLLLTILGSPLAGLYMKQRHGTAFLCEQAVFDVLGASALLLMPPALALSWLLARCCLKKLCESPRYRATPKTKF